MATGRSSSGEGEGFLRLDGRKCSQMRPLACNQGLLNQADGAACFALGGTLVLAAVYGPTRNLAVGNRQDQQIPRWENCGAVDVSHKPVDGRPTSNDVERQIFVANSIKETIELSNYPQTITNIAIQVLEDEGGSLAAAVNSASLAVVDAGMVQNGILGAVCCAIFPDGRILIDPTNAEIASSVATVTSVWHSVSWKMVACKSSGLIPIEQWRIVMNVSREAAQSVVTFMRMAFVSKCRKENRNASLQDGAAFANLLPSKLS